MRKLIPGILLIFAISCVGQRKDTLNWHEFDFPEAGLKAAFPCEPEKYFKSFQDSPRPIHVYGYSCETGGMKFLVGSKHYMDEFDDETKQNTFEAIESGLKTFLGEVDEIKISDYEISGLEAKFYDVKLKSGQKINKVAALSRERSYDAMIGFVNPDKHSQSDEQYYEKIATKFLSSFQITDNR